jgi:hypothetical protein
MREDEVEEEERMREDEVEEEERVREDEVEEEEKGERKREVGREGTVKGTVRLSHCPATSPLACTRYEGHHHSY